ncbi:MAG: hypothetical protein ACOH17_15230 [Cellulomonas sp.]
MTRHDTAQEAFDRFLAELLSTAAGDPDLIGIVAVGSTAARHRVDEWSDHDIAVVTTPRACERFRTDLAAWLPDAGSIAMSAREHHDGIVVVMDDGHVVELGVTSLVDLEQWHADPDAFDVLYDTGGVAEVMDHVVRKALPTGAPDDARDIRVCLTRLLIGVGRARRGELLSAGHVIRSEAAENLIGVIARRVPGQAGATPDPLDPRRRFEISHPDIAGRIAAALEEPPEESAQLLLTIAEQVLAPSWDDYPVRGARALRERLGWLEPRPGHE